MVRMLLHSIDYGIHIFHNNSKDANLQLEFDSNQSMINLKIVNKKLSYKTG